MKICVYGLHVYGTIFFNRKISFRGMKSTLIFFEYNFENFENIFLKKDI